MPALRPAWQPRNLKVPDPVALANGVAFVLATGENVNQRAGPKARQTENTQPAVLYAFDARTGKELYNSAMGTWVHFSGLAIAQGRIYAVRLGGVLFRP